jgi:hypothetical protein
MQTTFLKNRHSPLAAALVFGLVAGSGCVVEDTTTNSEEAAVTAAPAPGEPPVTPAMTWLANLPAETNGELALGKLFAQGTATYLPVGSGTGYPVLFNSVPELNWLASQLWGGKTLRIVSSDTQPNGDPIVRLDNKIIKTPTGGLFNLFDAYVTRGVVAQLKVGVNSKGEVVPPPSGTLPLIHLSFLSEPVVVDEKPSILLNYFEDQSLPVIRRVLDEIREIDVAHCKGLFLGRAHVRRCESFNCGEVPSGLLDFPVNLTFETKATWKFWTYFLLNFGQPDGQCDLAPVIATITQQLQAEGISADLPAPPPVH